MEKFSEIWTVDLSITRLKRVIDISTKIKVVQDDAQTLEKIPSEYFDLATSTQVIEHVEDDFKMLNTLKRIVCKGGIIRHCI